jgi:hypothetical protein
MAGARVLRPEWLARHADRAVFVAVRSPHSPSNGVGRQHEVRDGRGGGIAVLQRFGGSVNLNVHLHALDGVFARLPRVHLRFCLVPAPWATDVAAILPTIVPAVRRLLIRHGLEDDEPRRSIRGGHAATCRLAAASVQGLAMAGAERQRPTCVGQVRACLYRRPFALPRAVGGIRSPTRACRCRRASATASSASALYALRLWPVIASRLTAGGDVPSSFGALGRTEEGCVVRDPPRRNCRQPEAQTPTSVARRSASLLRAGSMRSR